MTPQRVTRLQARVRGRVQGVGFRDWTQRTARSLGITAGYVRNLADGSVETTAESPDRSVLEAFLRCLRDGPLSARVDAVHPIWETDVEPRYNSFPIT